MQGTSFAFQAYQVLRFVGLMTGAMLMAWLQAPQMLIDNFETLLLLGGATTFFWVGGMLDGYLLLQNKSQLALQADVARYALRSFGLFSTCSAVAIYVCGMLFYPYIGTSVLFLFASYWFFETFSQSLPYQYIATGQGPRLIVWGVFSALSYCLGILIAVLMLWELDGIVAALATTAGLKWVWTMLESRQRMGSVQLEPALRREFWQISIPLMLATLLSQSAVYVDGFLVQRFFPDDFVDFRYGAREFPLVLLLANSLSVVRAGEIAAGLRDGKVDLSLSGLRAASTRLVWMLFPLTIVLLIVSGVLFDLLFAHRFPLAMPVFDIFLLLTIPRLMFPQTVVRGFQQTRWMSISAAVELVLNVGLSLLLMQKWGIGGIAMGTVLAYIVEKVILLVFAQRKLGVAWAQYAAVGWWFAGSIALIAVWLAKYLIFLS